MQNFQLEAFQFISLKLFSIMIFWISAVDCFESIPNCKYRNCFPHSNWIERFSACVRFFLSQFTQRFGISTGLLLIRFLLLLRRTTFSELDVIFFVYKKLHRKKVFQFVFFISIRNFKMAATSVIVLDRTNNTTCTINLHGT